MATMVKENIMWPFILQLILIIAFVSGVVILRPHFFIWTAGFAALLVLLTCFTPIGLFLILCWLMLFAIVIGIGVPQTRRKLLIEPMMKRIEKVLPPMSATERIALEAGDVWWEADLFRGRPDWQKLMQTTLPPLSEAEVSFLDNQVEMLCGMLNDWEIVFEHCDLPPQVWQYLKQERFFGMVIAKEYGGLGFSALAHSTVVTKIATRSLSAAVNVMVPNSLGPGELITQYGTDEQKQYYLPRLARGEEIPCFGLTAPDAGSDATAIPDAGIICRAQFEGKDTIGIRLNFDKRYITLAPIATVIGVAFKLYDPQHLIRDNEEIGITLALIPAKHPGIEIGKRHFPSSLAFMNGPVRGKDVFIPLDWIIGGPAMAGQGWHMLMECLSIGRSISLPALSTAVAKLSYRTTSAYAQVRRQFKLPIGRFEGIEESLARIAGFTYMLEAVRKVTAAAVDSNIKPSLASAIAKCHMTELARKIMDAAMDIHAGRAIQLGPRNYLGFLYQGTPISITVEGANILTRNLIIFGQGAVRCHPYVQQEMAAVAEADEQAGLIKFDKLLIAHMGYAISNLLAALGMGLGAAKLLSTPATGAVASLYQQITRMSAGLAFTADIAMLMLGGALKRKESLSARLGDVLSYLYIATSVLKYYHDHQQKEDDLLHVQWAVQYCLYNIQLAFDDFFANFSNRIVANTLRFIIFPLGRSYVAPLDKLSQELAKQMMQPSALRDRLTQYCYFSADENDNVGRMEDAFIKVLAAETAEKKLNSMLHDSPKIILHNFAEKINYALQENMITADEAHLLQEAERARADAIAVDEFSHEYLRRK